MCGALWSHGGVKVEAAFSSDKYKDESGDSSSVYYNWVNGSETSLFCIVSFLTTNILRVYEPSMRHIESVINHLQEADRDILTYLMIAAGVSWALVIVVVTLRYFYGCKLAKEHEPEYGPDTRKFSTHYGGGNMPQQGVMQLNPGTDRGPEPGVAYQHRRASMVDPDKPPDKQHEVTIKIEGGTNKDRG